MRLCLFTKLGKGTFRKSKGGKNARQEGTKKKARAWRETRDMIISLYLRRKILGRAIIFTWLTNFSLPRAHVSSLNRN